MKGTVERVIDVAVPVARAWRAFAESKERSQWEAVEFEIDPRPGGRIRWTLPGHEAEGRVEEVQPERLLRHSEAAGPHARTEVCVQLEPIASGTRIRVTHSGIPDDGPGDLPSTELGWTQALADLAVYLEHGVPAGRFVRRMLDPGMQLHASPAGLVVRRVEAESFAGRAGLRPDDLLLCVDGAPIYTRAELWVLMRRAQPGDELELEFIRDGARHRSRAAP